MSIVTELWPWMAAGLAALVGLIGAYLSGRRSKGRDMELGWRRDQDARREAARDAERGARDEVDGMSDADVRNRLRGDGWGDGR